jgi:hypothetical protein
MRRVGILIVLAGCPSAAQISPDASPTHDGMPHAPGMFVGWNANPALQVSHFQVVGDGGTDARTTRGGYLLAWTGTGTPGQESFPDAPAGVYSKVYLDLLGAQNAYEIHGTWRDLSNRAWPFRITDPDRLTVQLDCNKTLAGGAATTFAVRVDLRNALTALDFTKFRSEDGQLELESGSELDKLRNALLHGAFKIDN